MNIGYLLYKRGDKMFNKKEENRFVTVRNKKEENRFVTVRNKKGQFFLIAAIMISFIIIGIAGVKNYIQVSEEPINFKEKRDKIDLEGSWVIDQGRYTSSDNSIIEEKIVTFTKNFSEYLGSTGENFELTIIYGDESEAITQTYWRNESGYVSAGDFQGTNYNIKNTTIERYSGDSISDLESKYDLSLKENENFFFIITTSKGFENYVYGNI